jgi:excisionase family DNA binding protein
MEVDTMRITIDIDDEEIRRLLAPLAQQAPTPQAQTVTRLLNVKEVADRLGVSRNKVYELLNKGEIHSLAIGRTRRISPVALAEFVARPRENALDPRPPMRHQLEPSASYPKSPQAPPPRAEQRKGRRSTAADVIDLSPKPLPPGYSDSNMSAEEFESVLASMVEDGWPADVVEQMRADRREGVHRVNVLTINDTARYLGLSRYGVEKLVRAGKLRLFTIAPMYRDQKPETRIPAKDILALK